MVCEVEGARGALSWCCRGRRGRRRPKRKVGVAVLREVASAVDKPANGLVLVEMVGGIPDATVLGLEAA
jgi:hypothetical protein